MWKSTEVYTKPSKALGEGCEPAGEVKTMESLRITHLSWNLQGQESARQLSQWLSDGEGILDTRLRQLRHWKLWGFTISNTWPVTQLTAHEGISVRQHTVRPTSSMARICSGCQREGKKEREYSLWGSCPSIWANRDEATSGTTAVGIRMGAVMRRQGQQDLVVDQIGCLLCRKPWIWTNYP